MRTAVEGLREKIGVKAACQALGLPRSQYYRKRQPAEAVPARPVPARNWEVSADVRVLSIEWMAERDLNYIPSVQVWGNGQIQWVEYDDVGNRRVLRGQLTQVQLRTIIERLIQAGWFRNVNRLNDKDYALDYLTLNLKQVTRSRYADPADKASFEVIQFLRKGAVRILV